MEPATTLIDGYNPAAVIGYYRTEAEAKAAAARHVEEAGRPLIDTIAEWLAAGPWLP